jgi:hypothetical protein
MIISRYSVDFGGGSVEMLVRSEYRTNCKKTHRYSVAGERVGERKSWSVESLAESLRATSASPESALPKARLDAPGADSRTISPRDLKVFWLSRVIT